MDASNAAALIARLTPLVSGKSLGESLALVANATQGEVAFSTSFGREDQAITHALFSGEAKVRVFTLDTGRLFAETYDAWDRTSKRYGRPIESFAPDAAATGELVSRGGPFSFYASLEARKECCHVRKVEPLRRALAGVDLWITGIRSAQAATRVNLPEFEWDPGHSLVKWHPLLRWTDEELSAYLEEHRVPVHALHAAGFPSIGCQPCTRAVAPGEDVRAGRWWWEKPEQKECGLHVVDGKLVRAKG